MRWNRQKHYLSTAIFFLFISGLFATFIILDMKDQNVTYELGFNIFLTLCAMGTSFVLYKKHKEK